MTELQFIKRMVFREYPGKIFVLVINEILGSFLVIVGIGGIITVLTALLSGNSDLPGPLGTLFEFLGISEADIVQVLLLLVGIYLLQVTFEGLRQYISSSIAVELTRDLKEKMNNALLRADWLRFSALDQGKYMQSMISESSIAGGAVNDLGGMLAGGLIMILLLLWMVIFSFPNFLVFTLAGAAMMLGVRGLTFRARSISEQHIQSMKNMNNLATDTRYFFKTLIVENLLRKRVELNDSLIQRLAFLEQRRALYSITNNQLLNLVPVIVILFVSFYHLEVIGGSGSELVFDLLLLQRVGSYFSMFQSKRHGMNQRIPSYVTCLEMIEAFPADASSDTTSKEGQAVSLDRGIDLENVSFHYPGGDKGIESVNIALPAKGLIFVIGKSGSGKTTLIDMILGLLDPDEGRVFFDGLAFDEVDRSDLSQILAYVPQQAYLLEGTLRENLTFGSDGVDNEHIFWALDAADCGDMVRDLPKGLDSPVSPGGINFSGGERHRISIARALIRQARVLVLDEPSSHLDENSELSILESIKSLSKDMLIIVITHADKMIREADYIFYMEDGFCKWQGSYEKFVENKDNFVRARSSSDEEPN